jgi:outer membrane protein assembly factor BamA
VEGDGDRLTVRLAPGERQVFRDVEVRGAPEGEELRLAGLVPVRTGDPARRDLAAQAALLLERDLRGRGFPDAVVRPVLTAAGRQVDLRYEVESGSRFAVAGVDFAGGKANRGYLGRVGGLETGAPLSSTEIDAARGRLFRTGLFSRVTADVTRGADGAARVTFALGERPRYRLGYGVRWESAAGVSAVVDALDTNFLGRAITLGLRGLYEPDDQSGRLYLRTGGLLGSAISLESFLLMRRRFEEDELGQYTRNIGEAALQLARPFGHRTTGRIYARYRTERFYEPDPDPDNPFPLDFEIRRPYAGIQILFEGRDDPADPTAGRFASLDVSGSGSFLGSDFDYARLFGQVQELRPLSFAGRTFTWAQALRAGLARPFGGQALLSEERFFAGGELSVRGYETESLGPAEVLGDLVRPLGGEALLVINQELRIPLPWDLTGLLFFDAGQVWERSSDLDWDLATATGLGLRARTPLGLLRLDAGFPLDRRAGDPEYKLYLGFGNAF